jgi:cyclic pyranopterin phosphate synthase
MMRGSNDDELIDLVEFVLDRGIDIAFIEEMPLGDIGTRASGQLFQQRRSAARLQTRFVLVPSAESTGGPARYWRIPGSSTRVGFISPHSHNFCDTCNRVRITARGELYPCLGNNEPSSCCRCCARTRPTTCPCARPLSTAWGSRPGATTSASQMAAPQVLRFMSMTGG